MTIFVAGLKYWILAQAFWQHLAKHIKCSSHPHTPRCSCESYQISLNSYNRLQHMKRHSSIAQQGVLIVEQMSSLQRDPSLLHLLIFACSSKAHRTGNLQCGRTNICFDVGSLSVKWIEMVWKCLKPCSESRFGTRRKRNCKGNAKPSKHTIYKALQTRNFLLANDNDENDFGSNPNTSQKEGWCCSTMSPRKAVTRIRRPCRRV